MKSSIKIQAGEMGLPYIKVQLEYSDDPRDQLFCSFFNQLNLNCWTNWLTANIITGGAEVISVIRISPVKSTIEDLKKEKEAIQIRIDEMENAEKFHIANKPC